MISYLTHSQIDFDKWDKTILSCGESLPYGFSWYLNATTNGQWDALILGDYQCIMPLCWNSKIPTIKQIYQPLMTQQLGVFGADITNDILMSFVNSIPHTFKKIQINFHSNSPNGLILSNSVLRTNLILKLDRPYEQIQNGFSKSLKKRLRNTSDLQIDEVSDFNEIIHFFQSNLAQKEGFPDVDYQIPKQLFASTLQHKLLKMYEVKHENGSILASGIFMDFQGRLINIFGSSNQEGKALFAMHALLNYVIEKHAQSHKLFDFEGSDIEGVKSFFMSFGAENHPYFSFNSNQLSPLVKAISNLAKRIKY